VGIAEREEITQWKGRRTEARRNALLYIILALIPLLALVAVLVVTRHHS
jgi:hypothetical protein